MGRGMPMKCFAQFVTNLMTFVDVEVVLAFVLFNDLLVNC